MIRGIEWAPVSSIVRAARGGAITGRRRGAVEKKEEPDGVLFTAYGDGRGFEPLVERKLSLGLARIAGGADAFRAVNLRSPSAEQVGDGVRGRKASGLLMVDGVLYMLVRNAGNAQLAWSKDRGTTWEWADWRFSESFGCPTFLNSGRDYEGARDDFVYIYSHDSDSAYRPADRMVLGAGRSPAAAGAGSIRVLCRAGRIRESGVESFDRTARGVFRNAGRCYRSSVSYNGGLKRYLWCQTLPGDDPRFAGGFGIYDAPEPWGPWTTVFHTDRWDTGPGRRCRSPRSGWTRRRPDNSPRVFGEDCFSVRRGQLVPVQPAGRNAVRTGEETAVRCGCPGEVPNGPDVPETQQGSSGSTLQKVLVDLSEREHLRVPPTAGRSMIDDNHEAIAAGHLVRRPGQHDARPAQPPAFADAHSRTSFANSSKSRKRSKTFSTSCGSWTNRSSSITSDNVRPPDSRLKRIHLRANRIEQVPADTSRQALASEANSRCTIRRCRSVPSRDRPLESTSSGLIARTSPAPHRIVSARNVAGSTVLPLT